MNKYFKYLRLIGFILLFTVLCEAKDYKLMKNNPMKIQIDTSKPLSLNFNFFVKKVNILTNNEDDTKTVLVEKGLIIIFKKLDVDGQVIVTNKDGDSYIIYFESGGKKSVFSFNDPVFQFNKTQTVEIKPIATIIQNDIQRLVKKILLKKKLNGYNMIYSPQTIKTKDFILQRDKRFVGKKYIADVWIGVNNSEDMIHIDEEEFYTKGILAIALEKNNIGMGETFYVISILNKSSIKMLEESE